MAAISQVIPNLLGGVSQQPDPVKLPGQVREAENALLDPTFGCRKRPPTSFVAKLGDNIPTNAKWFQIFRDQQERYVVAIYRESDVTSIRVWEADTGVERTVNIEPGAGAYLDVQNPRSINELTINDYTLLANSEKEVSMSSDTSGDVAAEALVVINQVAYNTTYNIDFLKDGEDTVQEKVWRATKLSVSPGSFEELDDGGCTKAANEPFIEDSGDKTDLSFRLNARCQPTQVTTQVDGGLYPTGVENISVDGIGAGDYTYGAQGFFTDQFGQVDSYASGSYLYHQFTSNTSAGDITVRVEVRVTNDDSNSNAENSANGFYSISNVDIVSYTSTGSGDWAEGMTFVDKTTLSSDLQRYDGDFNASGVSNPVFPAGSTVGIKMRLSRVSQGDSTPEYSYKSRYTVSATLNSGGRNWRIGDSVNVTMAGQNYTVTVEQEDFGYSYAAESSVSYTTAADAASGTQDIGSIVGGLTAEIASLDNYTATPIGNVIHISRTDNRDFNIQTKGGTTNNALYGIKSSVNDITLLPNQCVPDVVLKVRNSADSDADDYYVKFISSAGDIPGQGSWEETHAPGITTDLNLSTMPQALVREADGTFTCRPLSAQYDDALYWAGRDVGDEGTNPDPSFVGRSIKSMFFYMNRLGFLSSDSVVLSQPGDYFNFFVGSAIAVSDADPIDMSTSSTRPATLKASLGTSKGLLLFAENSQFLMSTNEAAFGPATVKMVELTNYSYSSDVRPLETGVSIMFSTEADTFSKVYEMAVDSIDNRPQVSENTRIIPEYIPPNLTTSASSPNNSIVLYGNDTETLWIFKFFNSENKRSQAGWSKWIFPSPVHLIQFDHDTAYIVQSNNGSHILLKMEMLDDPRTSPITAFGSRFAPRLDNSLLKSQTTVEDGVDDNTKVVRFPDSSYVEGMTATIILTINGDSTLYRSPEVQSDETGYFMEVDSDLAAQDFIIGLEYDLKVHLPAFYVSVEKRPDRKNLPMVSTAYIDLYYSGRYEAVLQRKGYADRTIDLEATIADIYFANDPAIDDVGTRSIPVYCRGDYASLIISATGPLPASITGYRWDGHYNTRGISVIG